MSGGCGYAYLPLFIVLLRRFSINCNYKSRIVRDTSVATPMDTASKDSMGIQCLGSWLWTYSVAVPEKLILF